VGSERKMSSVAHPSVSQKNVCAYECDERDRAIASGVEADFRSFLRRFVHLGSVSHLPTGPIPHGTP
jgi:hypothetical protein